jgi:hypothetical protein
MRTVLITVIGIVVVVLAWSFFAYKDLSHFQGLVDEAQVKLESRIPKLLDQIPEYTVVFGKYFQSDGDKKKAQDLNQAGEECASVLKAISTTKGISADEVNRLNSSLIKLNDTYIEVRDRISVENHGSPAWKDPHFTDMGFRLDYGFGKITWDVDYVNSLMDWYLEKETDFPKSVIAGVFGFPKWKKFYAMGSVRYHQSLRDM